MIFSLKFSKLTSSSPPPDPPYPPTAQGAPIDQRGATLVKRVVGEIQVIRVVIIVLVVASRGVHEDCEEQKHNQTCHDVRGHLRESGGCVKDGSFVTYSVAAPFTRLGCYLEKRFCKLFSESSKVVLQLCPAA